MAKMMPTKTAKAMPPKPDPGLLGSGAAKRAADMLKERKKRMDAAIKAAGG